MKTKTALRKKRSVIVTPPDRCVHSYSSHVLRYINSVTLYSVYFDMNKAKLLSKKHQSLPEFEMSHYKYDLHHGDIFFIPMKF